MKEKILELRNQGFSYRAIQESLGCSKGTISYHCGNGQKKKSYDRNRKNNDNLNNKLRRKLDGFISRNVDKIFKYVKREDSMQDYCDKLIKNPICYLTGRKIDLNDTSTYNLDHIVPFYISHDNSVDNLGLSCKEANHSKSFLTVEEYLSLCKEVLEFNGFRVEKIL